MEQKKLNIGTFLKKIAFVICLLICQLSFSQTTFPKKLIIEGDTAIVITPEQLTNVNLLIVENQKCRELLLQAKLESTQQDKLIAVLNARIEGKTEQNNLSLQEIEILKEQKAYLEKQNKRQKIKTKTSAIIGAIAGGGLVYLILK